MWETGLHQCRNRGEKADESRYNAWAANTSQNEHVQRTSYANNQVETAEIK